MPLRAECFCIKGLTTQYCEANSQCAANIKNIPHEEVFREIHEMLFERSEFIE